MSEKDNSISPAVTCETRTSTGVVTDSRPERLVDRYLLLLHAFYLAIALIGLNAPFLSVHNERQNQTYDIARNVFREGWRGVMIPKASFSLAENPERPFTVCRLEVPFHGILGWPIAVLTGQERAAVRLVSVLFALASIQLFFLILRQWIEPKLALGGTVLWATTPLMLHFGQVPMPDILCVTGMLAAFHFALRGRLVPSSTTFMFAALAKQSVLVFGLPILTALLIARECRSLAQGIRLSIAWGILPLASLVGWLALDLISPETPWTVLRQIRERGDLATLINPHFYIQIVGCMLPFGLGIVGTLGLGGATLGDTPRMNRWLKASIVISVGLYVFTVLRKIPEPQYFLPLLVWGVLAAALGFSFLLRKYAAGGLWRLGLWTALAAHVLLAALLVRDLKTSRVSDFAGVQTAARLLPADARVVVIYKAYGGAPAVWLERNVFALAHEAALEEKLTMLRRYNFSHLAVMEVESRHSGGWKGRPVGFLAQIARILHLKSSTPAVPGQSSVVPPASPTRTYCDQRFPKLYESPSIALYSLTLRP